MPQGCGAKTNLDACVTAHNVGILKLQQWEPFDAATEASHPASVMGVGSAHELL